MRASSLFDGALITMLGLLVALAIAAHARGGPELLRSGLQSGIALLVRFAPLLAVSFLAAGLAEVLIPRDWVPGALGPHSGLAGILIAAGAGALTPSGPYVALPLAAVLARAGVAPGPLAAYVTGWALLALHRLVAWEIPILGLHFALLRWSVSLVLPVLAGLAARALTRP